MNCIFYDIAAKIETFSLVYSSKFIAIRSINVASTRELTDCVAIYLKLQVSMIYSHECI